MSRVRGQRPKRKIKRAKSQPLAEIAANKLAFINEPDQVQDIADVAYIEKGLEARREDIASSVETIAGERVRFEADGSPALTSGSILEVVREPERRK